MNIKAELNKPFRLFKSLSTGMVVFATIVAVLLTTLIIGFGQGVFIKVIFIVLGSAIALIIAYDSSSKSDEEKNDMAMKNGIVILFILFIIEIGLFFHAQTYSKSIPITVVDGTTTERVSTGKRDTNDNLIYKDELRKTLEFYNMENNDKMGYRIVHGMSDDKITLFKNVTGKEYYIDYFPFFKYSEEFKYKRD